MAVWEPKLEQTRLTRGHLLHELSHAIGYACHSENGIEISRLLDDGAVTFEPADYSGSDLDRMAVCLAGPTMDWSVRFKQWPERVEAVIEAGHLLPHGKFDLQQLQGASIADLAAAFPQALDHVRAASAFAMNRRELLNKLQWILSEPGMTATCVFADPSQITGHSSILGLEAADAQRLMKLLAGEGVPEC